MVKVLWGRTVWINWDSALRIPGRYWSKHPLELRSDARTQYFPREWIPEVEADGSAGFRAIGIRWILAIVVSVPRISGRHPQVLPYDRE